MTQEWLSRAFLWSSTGSKKAHKGPTSASWQQHRRCKEQLCIQTCERVGGAMEEEKEEEAEDEQPPPLFLHSIEAACLDELVFDPEADYEQVLAEARSYAKQAAAAAESNGKYGFTQEQQPSSKSKSRNRTAKVYFVPPPILGADADDQSFTKKNTKKQKQSSSRNLKDLLIFWRRSNKKKKLVEKQASAPPPTPRKKRGSASGPLPLYTDGNGEFGRRPFHRNWSSQIHEQQQCTNPTKMMNKPQSGPLKLSAAISCRQEDAAISPYVPLKNSTHTRWSTSSSGPLYVTT